MIQSNLQTALDRPVHLGNAELILWSSEMFSNGSPPCKGSTRTKGKEVVKHDKPRILIVDDNAAVRKAIAKLLLRSEGWEACGEATTGAEAIAMIRQLRPEVVLLDITLPDLSGFEVATAIRTDLPSSNILIVSQHEPAQMLAKAVAAGAKGYVTKTNLSRDLIPAIKSLLPKPS
jgi:CheY-like chemotaxis protein